jgi:hypothetical protein
MSDNDDPCHGVPEDSRPSEPRPIDDDGAALVLVAYASAMHAVQQLLSRLRRSSFRAP